VSPKNVVVAGRVDVSDWEAVVWGAAVVPLEVVWAPAAAANNTQAMKVKKRSAIVIRLYLPRYQQLSHR
jgi:hypothetical protein